MFVCSFIGVLWSENGDFFSGKYVTGFPTVDAAVKFMPAGHYAALKRYAPFRLCLTSDDNGVCVDKWCFVERVVVQALTRTPGGDGGLVLGDNRQVRSIPPDAYLWLSPKPATAKVMRSNY